MAGPTLSEVSAPVEEQGWCVYVLRCRGGCFYIGSTVNLVRRLREHEKGKGSKFVRSRMPFDLVKVVPCETGQDARRLEYRLKRLKRDAKIRVLSLEEQSGPVPGLLSEPRGDSPESA